MKENSVLKNLTKGKKLLFILAPVCALVLTGGIVTAVVLASGSAKNDVDIVTPTPDEDDGDANTDITVDNGGENSGDTDADVSGGATVFANPLKEMNIIHTFGFYYNSTLDSYYEHEGIDVSAEAGGEVYATTDGTVTAVYTGDVLTGNQVILDNGNGIVTVYNFIDPAEGLVAGSTVKQGDVIGTVSEATGGEYKDGAHVHIEVYLNGAAVDPENYLITTQK